MKCFCDCDFGCPHHSTPPHAPHPSPCAQVSDLGKTVEFFTALGLMETRRKESDAGKFTLVFLASAPGEDEASEQRG